MGWVICTRGIPFEQLEKSDAPSRRHLCLFIFLLEGMENSLFSLLLSKNNNNKNTLRRCERFRRPLWQTLRESASVTRLFIDYIRHRTKNGEEKAIAFEQPAARGNYANRDCMPSPSPVPTRPIQSYRPAASSLLEFNPIISTFRFNAVLIFLRPIFGSSVFNFLWPPQSVAFQHFTMSYLWLIDDRTSYSSGGHYFTLISFEGGPTSGKSLLYLFIYLYFWLELFWHLSSS